MVPFEKWLPTNQVFYTDFRSWLTNGKYGVTSINTYSVATRIALGFLNKSYWKINPIEDVKSVRQHLAESKLRQSTQFQYNKGLDKLVEYLYLRSRRKCPDPEIHWETYLQGLPDGWVPLLKAYLTLCTRNWHPEWVYQRKLVLLGKLSRPLRWLVGQFNLKTFAEITPEGWYDFVEYRLEARISPITINGDFSVLKSFLSYLNDQGIPICQRILRVDMLDEPRRFPRDVPLDILRQILAEMEITQQSSQIYLRRLGVMDKAWVLLMLHCGLRTGEVRRLKYADLDWENRKIRIEQSKGLKDRFVFLSTPVINALKAYIEVRGPLEDLPEEHFIHRHLPLGSRFCQVRLKQYTQKTGLHVTPHQLRHSCATLLLNAGAPVLTVQTILGHVHIDTTLGYARLYDGTVAADYYRAMVDIEDQFSLPEDRNVEPMGKAELVAIVDALKSGTLNENQIELVDVLRKGILALEQVETQQIIPAQLDLL